MSGPGAAGYQQMIDAAALLLGPDGAFITGSDLLIDGGVSPPSGPDASSCPSDLFPSGRR
jgi:hypothetical protein